ncbi:hypothetical protein HF668_10875 [Acidithiobacillus ferridurans]|uniref:hypothetical protein n=1 Tax=Acidithiobacillus ferridurans TaxID=1232575 RepID=UPI001C06A49B|nr:hypothetical protein [Acidithiobacillus ferridurans]MBU2805639.1 hypothetical protein [Acidithiobacillus ferridurans]
MSAKPKTSSRSRRIPRAGERLLDLAWEVADRLAQDNPSHRQENLLSDLVERVLEQGDHAALREAYERLEHAEREDALQILSYWVIHHASVLQAQVETAAGAEDARIHVFLLPILLLVPEGVPIPSSIPSSPDLSWQSPLFSLVTSFRRHGLIVGEGSILILPELYSVAELPHDVFAWRQHLHRFALLLQGGRDDLVRSHSPETVKAKDPQLGVSWALRYLQIAVVVDVDHPDPGPLISGDLVLCTVDEAILIDSAGSRANHDQRGATEVPGRSLIAGGNPSPAGGHRGILRCRNRSTHWLARECRILLWNGLDLCGGCRPGAGGSGGNFANWWDPGRDDPARPVRRRERPHHRRETVSYHQWTTGPLGRAGRSGRSFWRQ